MATVKMDDVIALIEQMTPGQRVVLFHQLSEMVLPKGKVRDHAGQAALFYRGNPPDIILDQI